MKEILEFYPPEEQEKIMEAYSLAKEALCDKLRENKHPFIEHPLGVARIVAKEIGLQYDAIIAIFLHETLRFFPDTIDTIPKGMFSKEVLDMAICLNKISTINPKDTGLEAENYKRLIVSYSKDPRVIIIKLADRLDVMRNIALLPPESQKKKVTETILLYIPIAHQLGLYNLKSELENIFFKYSEPERYRTITNLLSTSELERKALITSFIDPLQEKLEAAGITASLKSRTKTAYSIWKKMQKQGIPFEGVQDVFAIRIIIDAPPEREKEHELCWKAYSIVTEEYDPDTSRLRNWLSKPKQNGYESLHTTVRDSNGNSIEVQIRTKRMDLIAENGLAAHWSYKGIKEETGLTQWLNSVRATLESNQEIGYEQASEFLQEDVFVFTPDGALKRLRAGSCVLDFAFSIHSTLGARCSGAKINGKVVSIREKLVTGNVVEIITSKNQRPTSDWLNYVVTSKARAKIRQFVKEEGQKKATAGKEMLERRLKNWKLEINDDDLFALCKKYKQKTITDFYAALEDAVIDVIEVKDYLASAHGKGQAETPPTPILPQKGVQETASTHSRKKESSNFLIIDGKLGNIGYKMAKCCNPIYGDQVFGFVSIKEGIKIHRISCPNAARLIENYPYRIQKVKWKEDVGSVGFQVSLKVIIDDSSVFANILNVISGFNAPIRSSTLTLRENKSKGEYDANIKLLVASNQLLDKIISAIKKTKGVTTVLRG